MPIRITCETCNTEYKVKPYTFTHRKTRFCSKDCRNSWMRMNHVPWNKGITKATHPQLSNSGKPKGIKSWNSGLKMPETTGINNSRWIADRTRLASYKDSNEYRNSPISKEWASEVKNRDGWKCRIANQECEGKVYAHHILTWKDYPELRYEVNNGITLCHAHHPRARAEEVRLAPVFTEIVRALNGK